MQRPAVRVHASGQHSALVSRIPASGRRPSHQLELELEPLQLLGARGAGSALVGERVLLMLDDSRGRPVAVLARHLASKSAGRPLGEPGPPGAAPVLGRRSSRLLGGPHAPCSQPAACPAAGSCPAAPEARRKQRRPRPAVELVCGACCSDAALARPPVYTCCQPAAPAGSGHRQEAHKLPRRSRQAPPPPRPEPEAEALRAAPESRRLQSRDRLEPTAASQPGGQQRRQERLERLERHQCPQRAGREPSAGGQLDECSQLMYDSLAAELKAKLGSRRTAPILLPPRDYDTVCRSQGKLAGIEQRRSTNPALVGPAAVSAAPPQAGPKSDEPSPRACKSRGSPSNSSSGLGSISMTGELSSSSCASASSSASSSSGAGSPRAHSPWRPAGAPGSSQHEQNHHLDHQNQHQHHHHHIGLQGCDSKLETAGAAAAAAATKPAAKAESPAWSRRSGPNYHNPGAVSEGALWNGRVEVPLKINSAKNGNTYLATKQIIY